MITITEIARVPASLSMFLSQELLDRAQMVSFEVISLQEAGRFREAQELNLIAGNYRFLADREYRRAKGDRQCQMK